METPGLSIMWCLTGSVFIALLAQSSWFREASNELPVIEQLLRPSSMYHFVFVSFHVIGGAAYCLDAAGFGLGGGVANADAYGLALAASAQQMMLLGHASVTAGMKIVGFHYEQPRYVIPVVRPYSLIVVSLILLGLGSLLSEVSSLWNLREKLLAVSSTAVILEVVFAVRRHNLTNLFFALLLLCLILLGQLLSGWKGLIVFPMITLGALLFPIIPRRTLIGWVGFIMLWTLLVHPFGTTLRGLEWYAGVERDRAIRESLDVTMNMTLAERIENAWTFMVGRANDLYQFRKYLEYVPRVHDYYGLSLVEEAMIALVPRIVWAGKPDLERVAMGRVYEAGVVSERATVSAKSNFYQDAFMSGGWGGVIPACLILGFLCMKINRLCERFFGGYDIGTGLVYMSLFGREFNMPSNFLFFLGAIWTSLMTAAILFILGRLGGFIVPARSPIPADRGVGTKRAFASSGLKG